MSTSNYFQILNCNASSSFEQIKESYRKLALKYHPDKANENEGKMFAKINEAWNVLKDERLRKEHESEILAEETARGNVYESVSLCKMQHRTDPACYVYPCRCGAEFCLEEQLIEGDETIVVACDTCSLLLEIFLPAGD